MKKLLLLFVIMLSMQVFAYTQVYQGSAANRLIKGSEMVWYAENNANPVFIKYGNDSQPSFTAINDWVKSTFNTTPEMNQILIGSEKDKLGYNHYRYQQTLNGIPIHEGVFIVHVYNNKIQSFNGTILSDPDISNTFSVSPETALDNALKFVNASAYKWQNNNADVWLKQITGKQEATYFPEAVKEIIYSEQEKSFRTAYKFDIYATKPLSRQHVYVDAITGKVIKKLETLHTTDAEGTAVTKYSGTKTLTTDSVSPTSFRLRESGRGNGIFTYNMLQQTDYASSVDFTDADNYWNNVNAQLDEAAGDAHWGAEMTYDYFFIKHARNSIDGNGFALYSYVHYDQAYGNAFWDGTCMTYGDGETNNPFCALDICGHEITHGLDSYTANLDYAVESGAMNEGFSDIFGTAIEFYAKPSQANWTCGENIGFIIRDLQNPNSQQNPDTYLGDYWDPGQEVHANSTVLSHWYYLVCQGGSGTNDNSDVYSVTGIGMEKASAIAFRMLTVYLTSTADYQDARFYAIVSATDLYGGCSPEVEAVTNAMYAVGLGNAYSPVVSVDFTADNTEVCSAPLTVQFENQTLNASSYLWYFGDGTTSTLQNPTHTYTSLGDYDVKLVGSSVGCGTDSVIHTAFISIATNNSNYAVMPANETGEPLNCCTGTLFDSGEAGDYSNNTNGIITIAPTGASSVILNFSSFNFETGYDYLYIYDGPSTSSTLIGQYDGSSLPNGGTIQSTFGSVTLRQTTDGGVVESGFQLTWQCNIPSTPPVSNFYASEVMNCTGVIHFHDMSMNGPQSWHWNFGDGDTSNLQNPVHTYQTNGTYTVTLTTSNDFGSDTTIQTDYIVISNMPSAPTVTPGSGCDSTQITLLATGSGQLDWYDALTGGTLLYTGNTFVTPTLYDTTTFYVEDVMATPLEYVGKTAKSNDAQLHNNNNYYLIFDCYTPLVLKSVKVYAGDTKDRIIELSDSAGNVLQTMTVNVPEGESRVNLNFDIPVGNKMRLACGTSDPNLYRDQSGITFPYVLAGKISITGTNAGSNIRYYYYYDWEVQERPCISPRVPVLATVYDCSGIESVENASQFDIYPNPAENEFFVEFNTPGSDDFSFVIYDLIGKTVLSRAYTSVNGLNKLKFSCETMDKGVYLIQIKNLSGNHYQKIVIE